MTKKVAKRGRGRPKMDPVRKKKAINLKLPLWFIEHLDSKGERMRPTVLQESVLYMDNVTEEELVKRYKDKYNIK